MNGSEWANVLIEWVNCLKLGKPVQKLSELRSGDFFANLRKVITKTSNSPRDVLSFIFELLEGRYPNFVFDNKEVHLSDLSETDLRAVTSLLMHYTCIYDRRDVLTSPLCRSLSQCTQLVIKNFLETMVTGVNNAEMDGVIRGCLKKDAVTQWPPDEDSDSPLQVLLQTPISKVRGKKLDRAIMGLRGELEVERFEKADLQGELGLQVEKNQKLEKKLALKNSEIARLRENVMTLEGRTPPHFQDRGDVQRRLKIEINDLETYVRQLETEQQTIIAERDSTRDKCRFLETQCIIWEDKFFETEKNLENLKEQSEAQDEEFRGLKCHCDELTAILDEYRTKASNDSSLYETFSPMNHSRNSYGVVMEDLACSVVDVQLREAQKRNSDLEDEIKDLREQLKFLENKHESALAETKATLDKREAELKTLLEEEQKANEEMKDEKEKLEEVNEKLKIEVRNLEKVTMDVNENMAANNIEHEQAVAILKEETESLRQQLKFLEDKHESALAETKANLDKREAELKALLEEEHEANEEMKDEKEKLEEANEKLKIEVRNLEKVTMDVNENMAANNIEHEQAVAILKEETESLRQQLKFLENKHESALAETKANLDKREAELKALLVEEHKANEEMKDEKEKLEEANEKLKIEVRNLEKVTMDVNENMAANNIEHEQAVAILKEETGSLREQLKFLENKHESALAETKATLDKREAELKTLLEEEQKANEEMKDEKEKLEEVNEKLKIEVRNLEKVTMDVNENMAANNIEHEQAVAILKEETESLREQAKFFEQKHESELEASLIENKRVDALLAQSKESLLSLERENESLGCAFQGLDEKYTVLKRDKEGVLLRIKELERENKIMKEEMSKKEIEDFIMAEKQEVIKILEEKVQDYELTINGLKTVVDKDLDTVTELRHRLKTVEDREEETIREMVNFLTKNQVTCEGVFDIRRLLFQFVEDLQRENEELKVNEGVAKQLKGMIQKLQGLLDRDCEKVEDLEVSMKKIYGCINNALECKDVLDLKLRELEGANLELREEKLKSRTRIEELEVEVEKKDEEIAKLRELEKSNLELKEEKENIRSRIEELEIEVAKKGEELLKLRELEGEKEKNKSRIEELERTIESLKKIEKKDKENVLGVSTRGNVKTPEELKKELMTLKKKLLLTETSKTNLEKILKNVRQEKKKLEDNASLTNDVHYKLLLQEHIKTKEEHEKVVKKLEEEIEILTKMKREEGNIREAYGDLVSANSKLEMENLALRKINEERKNEEMITEAYEKLLEENNKLLTEVDTIKYKRTRDKEEFVRILKRERDETSARESRRIAEVRAEYEGKLEKMKEKMLKLYREEVNNEVQRLNSGRSENIALKSDLFEAEQKIQLLQMERDMLRTRYNVESENFLVPKERESVVPPSRTYSRVTTITSRAPAEDSRRASTLPGRIVTEEVTVSRRTSIGSVGHDLQMEDEEDLFNDKYLADLKEGRCLAAPERESAAPNRLSQLAWRNSMVPPHLKSSYPAELQFASPGRFKDDDIKFGNVQFEDSLCRLLPGDKPRKKDFGTTSYKRPGPPTPSKNGGRPSLQGNEVHPIREHCETKTPKKSTPSRIRALFTSRLSMSKDSSESQSTTPNKGRRLNIFRKPR